MHQKIKISDLLKKFNLPEHTELVGVVVHLSTSDEFLGFYENTPDAENFMWVKIPDLAYIFPTEKQAQKFVKSYGKDSVVGLLFDLGDSYSLQVPN